MRKKLAVSTFCVWTSYGSILQAYALKIGLTKLGCDSFVFTDEKENHWASKIILNNGVKAFIISLYNLFKSLKVKKQYTKTKSFINSHIDLIKYEDYNELLKNPPKVDAFLAGSDQVFNPLNSKTAFFLDFVDDVRLRNTYACSMGVLDVPEENEKSFRKLINNFSTISVREQDNIDVLKRYNPNAKYFRHIDPTFLLNKNEWQSVEKKYDIKGKYILVYPIFWDNKINYELNELHEKSGINIFTICSGFSRVYANKRLFDVGVQEFIWLVDHAEAVVTSSFHGVSLSIIFNKKFSVVINPNSPSRIQSLLGLLNIKTLDVSQLIDGTMDYSETNKIIIDEQKRSFDYLNWMLNNEK